MEPATLLLVASRWNRPTFVLPDCNLMLPTGTELGALRYQEIYLDYDGPQLFSAKGAEGRLFLAMHAPRDAAGDNWLWLEVSPNLLANIEANKVDLYSAFNTDKENGLYVVTWRSNEVFVRQTNSAEIPERWLPRPGVFLIDDDEEEADTASDSQPALQRSVRSEISSYFPDDISQLLKSFSNEDTPVWRDEPNVHVMLAAMRVPPHEAAQHTGRIICDFIIQPGQDRTDVGTLALGNFLVKTQRMVDAFGGGFTRPKPNTAAARNLKSRMELRAVAPFPGSFGLRLEAMTGSTVPDKSLTAAFDTLFRLLAAGRNLSAVRQILAPLGRRAAVQYRAFAKALAEVSGDFAAELGTPGAQASEFTTIRGSEVATLAKLLDQEVLEETRDDDFFGRLMGASLRNKLFLLEGKDKAISGRIADEALPEMANKTLSAMHKARIRTITEINETTGEEIEHHVLLKIEAIT
jgi:L-rhamnose mutarotase